jgi:arylsulfatase A-like enzyme
MIQITRILSGFLLLALCSALHAQTRPNILWIFTDDHAYQAIGAYGGRLQSMNLTPNLDNIAEQGMRFDRCYVGNSICAPARATLLTGKHSHKNGKLDNYDGFDHRAAAVSKVATGERLPDGDDW